MLVCSYILNFSMSVGKWLFLRFVDNGVGPVTINVGDKFKTNVQMIANVTLHNGRIDRTMCSTGTCMLTPIHMYYTY